MVIDICKLFVFIVLFVGSCVSKSKLGLIEDQEVKMFLDEYLKQYAQLEKDYNLAMWNASVSGKKEDFDKLSQLEFKLKEFHSRPDMLKRIEDLLHNKQHLSGEQKRSLELAYLRFKENQIDKGLLKKIVSLSTEIASIFNTYRAKYKGKLYSNNELLEMLSKETDSANRRLIWNALKQVGQKVAPKLIRLAHLRNKAARSIGFNNFWHMNIVLQEYDVDVLLSIFKELDELTLEPFMKIKAEIDAELSKKFQVSTENLRPWHYDNPFFQEAPPSDKVNPDLFYSHLKKEDIVEIAKRFFSDIGLDVSDILERSDLYDKTGKDQHAFCVDIDRLGDVRILTNIKANAKWMETTLHELGHAVYSKYIDRSLLYNVRDSAHIFITEAVAMFFGALAINPAWMIKYIKLDPNVARDYEKYLIMQRRREQLIFSRWTLVMLNFEKSFYENPNQNLNQLWWDLVERYQKLHRPLNRNKADWASKPHFTIAPVYYHNYMLGELFAAQLRSTLTSLKLYNSDFKPTKQFGNFFIRKVFKSGASRKWSDFVSFVTGSPLSSKFFVFEITPRT